VAHNGDFRERGTGGGGRQKGEGYVSRELYGLGDDFFSLQADVLQIFKCSSDETSLLNPHS
jgi:hypothetical protein